MEIEMPGKINGNGNKVLHWERVGMGTIPWEWKGMVTIRVISNTCSI